jgi:hypothetical protein
MPPLLFGEWRPDVADYEQQHSKTITNALARGDGYGPVRSLQAFTDVLPSACRGAFLATNADGTIAVFAGTATNLYRLDNTDLTWNNVTITDATELVYTDSTNIGDLTGGGGLAAAFDGTTAQATADCARLTATTSAWVGKTLAAPQAIRSVKIYGSNDAGYVVSINPTVSATVYGKNGTAPATGTDGTAISAALTFTDTADESVARTITCTDTGTEWDHVWVYFTHNGAANTVSPAEIEIFSTADYALTNTQQWQFAQFGPIVVAVNQNDPPQTYTVASSAAFSDLAGSPPQASFVTVVANHLVLSGLLNNPDGIAWSALDDATNWSSNGADTQDFQDGGAALAIAGGEFGVVFQSEAIRRMAFVGGDTIFEFERIVEGEGLAAPYSVIRSGPRTFFLGTSGFQTITAGQYPVSISKERFHRTFLEDWDDGNPHLLIGANEARSSRVWWFYKPQSGADDQFSRAICYDWALDRPSYVNGVSGEYVAVLSQPGVTLEGLEDLGFLDLDAMEISLDDFAGSSGQLLGVFGTDHAMGFLTGQNLEAIIDTPDYAFEKRFFVRQQRPITDATEVYGSLSTRAKVSDTAVQSTESAMNSIGLCPHRADTRMARFRLRFPAGTTWTYALGTEPQAANTGDQ